MFLVGGSRKTIALYRAAIELKPNTTIRKIAADMDTRLCYSIKASRLNRRGEEETDGDTP